MPLVRRFCFVVLLLAALAAPARAAPVFSGEELLAMCVSKYDTDYGFCAGYVSAVAQAMLGESIGNHRACNHQLVRSQQAIDLFTSYAAVFPEQLKGEARDMVAAAFARAFPCR